MGRKAWHYLYITLIHTLVLVTKNVAGVTCEFWNKEFIHLSKHTWHCKSKIISITTVGTESTNRPLTSNESRVTVNNKNEIITCVNQDFDPHEKEKGDHEFCCYCGRSFSSLRGLNIHRRTCFVGELMDVKELFKDAVEEILNDATYDNDEIIDYEDLPKGLIKRGVILPNSLLEWERTNEYFRDHLHHSDKVKDINKEIKDIQNKIYEYFSETHAQLKDKEINECKNWAKNQLKNHLKLLKSQNPKPVEEIKRVLRKRYKQRSDTDFDHQTEFYKNYWRHCEKVFEPQSEKIKPTFNKTDCKQYFRKILSERNHHKTFNPPSWMKKLKKPTINFNLETPSYVEINKIIMKMKSSVSPCPNNAISIIAFQKCPIL